jgi:uncharacterized damage-inducible protein DinB
MTIDDGWPAILGRQLGAAADMLENAITACPDELWDDGSGPYAFWCVAFHALFWLDLYLGGSVEGYAPPAPFALDELDPAGRVAERPYTRGELRDYLGHCRRHLADVIGSLTADAAARRCRFRWGEVSYAELLLYNLRHVQHHVGQLNRTIREATGRAPRWVARGAS